jgi:putative ABC transport system ATP-binding protein
MIQIKDVTRDYQRGADRVSALQGVSLEVPAGRFVALMGPSGSGKSTLLNILAGLDRPTRGSVRVADTDLCALNDEALAAFRARHVGFVFQFFNLIPVLDALHNVELPLLLTRMSKAERLERARTALGVVGLTERAGHKPSELSGGEQQRVAIARAVVVDPSLIVADEPTGDLDAHNARETLSLLREMRSSFGTTVVMVTHDPRAEEFVDEVHTLDKGVVQGAPRPGGATAHS